jgi:hypothetical protein
MFKGIERGRRHLGGVPRVCTHGARVSVWQCRPQARRWRLTYAKPQQLVLFCQAAAPPLGLRWTCPLDGQLPQYVGACCRCPLDEEMNLGTISQPTKSGTALLVHPPPARCS